MDGPLKTQLPHRKIKIREDCGEPAAWTFTWEPQGVIAFSESATKLIWRHFPPGHPQGIPGFPQDRVHPQVLVSRRVSFTPFLTPGSTFLVIDEVMFLRRLFLGFLFVWCGSASIRDKAVEGHKVQYCRGLVPLALPVGSLSGLPRCVRRPHASLTQSAAIYSREWRRRRWAGALRTNYRRA